jgi:uncharacterized membrane protein YoaK (UPF0700 family)
VTTEQGASDFPVHPTTSSLRLAALLVGVGGFLDAYSYIERGGVFANAQTANVVLFGVGAALGHWVEAWRHVPAIVAFILGIVFAEWVRRGPRPVAGRPARAALIAEALLLVVVGFLPGSFPAAVVVALLSFAAGVQGAMFATVHGWSYVSTLATVNLRTMTHSAYAAIADRDRGAGSQATTFGLLVVTFAAGAAAGGVASLHLHEHAIWIAAALLALGLALYAFPAGGQDAG